MAYCTEYGQSLEDDQIRLDDLTIDFRRTIRVPDNHQVSELPPGLGKFPLYQVKDYASKMTPEMANKGGLFLPMYQREAMWIQFKSEMPYAIKIYSGGVNAVSGEPEKGNAATESQRKEKLANGQSIQDYVVVPKQKWLDGIATSVGQVRQFVATPMGSGYSVEAQITGKEVQGGIQIEVTPHQRVFVKGLSGRTFQMPADLNGTVASLENAIRRSETVGHEIIGNCHLEFESTPLLDRYMKLSDFEIKDGSFVKILADKTHDWDAPINADEQDVTITVKFLTGNTIELNVKSSTTVEKLKLMVKEMEGTPVDQQRLVFKGKQLEDSRPLHYYNIQQDATVHLILSLRGGGPPRPEMSLAVGGTIRQNIVRDSASAWNPNRTSVFRVQIANSQFFRQITGCDPPPCPVNAATYAKQGLPFFSMDEDETNVCGDFAGIKSVAQMDKKPDGVVVPRKVAIGHPRLWKWRKPRPDSSWSGTSSSTAVSASDSSNPSTLAAEVSPPAPPRRRLPRFLTRCPLRSVSTFFRRRKSAGKSTGNVSAAAGGTVEEKTVEYLQPVLKGSSGTLGPDFFDPAGPKNPFLSVHEMEQDLKRKVALSA